MKKYGKVILGLLALVVLVGGSSILYSKLAEEYKPDKIGEIGGAQAQKESESAGDGGNDAENDAGSADGGSEAETPVATAPDFTVYDGEGNPVVLSDYFGKPIVLNFWASWCGPCKSEMPMFQEMYETYGEDMTFLMVNLTDGGQETVESAGSFIAEKGYTFPVYFDTEQQAAYAYYVSSIPVTYFIDGKGNLAAYGMGAMDEQSFLTGVDMVLEKN